MASVPADGSGGVAFGPIDADSLGELRMLNDTTFPVRYNERFYAEVLTTRLEHTKYAYWKGRVVGAICCRLEPHDVPGQQRLYIMTLGVQAAYRGRGIGSSLLRSVLEAVRRDNETAQQQGHAAAAAAADAGGGGDGGPVAEVYLHVQTSNADALSFYKRFAFENRGIIRNYYKRIEPPDCFVLALPLLEGDAAHPAGPAPAAAAAGAVGRTTAAAKPGALVA